ncbi:MAG: aldehyde ferredoxin oxidoreductase C-terminal domain-containing protein [Bacillota bacterium]|nr:aldehyde ferredoxin oxidoreductase C-terminal domain-containing protein [Bacillota bacterium]
MAKVYRVNVKTKAIGQEEIKEEYRLLGGRSLISKVLTDEVDPTCDPLGAGNKLIICTSLFAGTTVPAAHRLSVGGKSPLTGGIKEANSGGTAATYLARHNIKMIILEDLPVGDDWQLLKIGKDGTPELVPAADCAGLNNYALVEKLKERYGEAISVISIGTAGEMQYRNSTLQIIDAATGYPSRAAARGGLGSVMGSKKIKAVVIEKSASPHTFQYADKERYEAVRKKFVDITINNEGMTWLREIGTPAITDITGSTAILPFRNFSGRFNDKVGSIGAEEFLAKLKANGGKSGEPCQTGCVIHCSNRYNDANGEYLTSGLEYETIALCGSNCDIADLDAIARIDRLCDDFGIDTIETGVTIGVCMEAGKIPWGDGEAAAGLIEEMKAGSELGKILGQGALATGRALGVKRIPTVKGQAMAGYEPRNLKGTGVTYATSPMGADHTAGLTLEAPLDPLSPLGQAAVSSMLQPMFATADSLMCLFAWFSAASPETMPELMAGIYGGEWDFNKVIDVGRQSVLREKAFNTAAGFTAEDDRLPEFFLTERSPATGAVFDIKPLEIDGVLDY